MRKKLAVPIEKKPRVLSALLATLWTRFAYKFSGFKFVDPQRSFSQLGSALYLRIDSQMPFRNGESNMLKKETTKADATEREIEVDHIVSHQPQETLLQPIAESCNETNAYMEGFDNDAAILDEDEENICVTELSETGEETGRL